MMSDATELRMCLATVKRVDPYVVELVSTVKNVFLYKFDKAHREWQKMDIEGVLFLCKRGAEPQYSLVVINRLNINNLIVPIVCTFSHQMKDAFLMYRTEDSGIFSILFSYQNECREIVHLLRLIMGTLGNSLRKSTATLPVLPPPSSTQQQQQQQQKVNSNNVFELLTKAQENFENTASNTTPTKQQLPTSSSTPRPLDCASKRVIDFFAKASGDNSRKQPQQKTTAATASSPSLQGTHAKEENVLQRLLSNSTIQTVEHIEKQQRSTTPLAMNSNNKKNGCTVPSSSPLANELQPCNECATVPLQTQTLNDCTLQLMTPMMFTPSTSVVQQQQQQLQQDDCIDVLTEKQLAQVLIHLLKTNTDFTRQIHEAYVASIMEKVNTTSSSNLT